MAKVRPSLSSALSLSINDVPLSLAPPGARTQFSGKVIVASGACMILVPASRAGRAGFEEAKTKKEKERKKEKRFPLSKKPVPCEPHRRERRRESIKNIDEISFLFRAGGLASRGKKQSSWISLFFLFCSHFPSLSLSSTSGLELREGLGGSSLRLKNFFFLLTCFRELAFNKKSRRKKDEPLLALSLSPSLSCPLPLSLSLYEPLLK